ncbi:MAG TPA: cohesin domain-containing protein [Candidatus Hydrogenedentes bacterium]|nr:cohesin domain-containing protein [Candidatus Hydrogenedentota bacterium]
MREKVLPLIIVALVGALTGSAIAAPPEADRLQDEAARQEAIARMESFRAAAPDLSGAQKSPREGLLDFILTGHTDDVHSVAYSPDGTMVLTGSWDGSAKLWNATTGEEIRTLRNPNDPSVWSVVFYPDGSTAVTGAFNRIRFWNLETGQETRSFTGTMHSVAALAMSPNGSRLASGSPTAVATVWDLETGEPIYTLEGHTDWVDSLAFSPNGARLLTGSWDGTAKLWDLETGGLIRTFIHDAGKSTDVTAVAFSPDGTKVLTVGAFAKIWDSGTGAELSRFSHCGVSGMFSPDGTRVLTADFFPGPTLWLADTGQALCILPESSVVLSAVLSPDGTKALTGDMNSSAKIWTLIEGTLEDEVIGTVADAQTGSPLGGAKLTLFDFATGALLSAAQSQSDGSFNFVVPDIQAFLALRVERSGYESLDIPYFRAPANLQIRLNSQAPAAPTGVVAIPGANGIVLRWNASSSANIAGYRVERADSADGPYTILFQTPASQTRHADTDLPAGKDFWYRIVALDARGNASQPSASVTARAGTVTVWMPNVNGAAGERVRIPVNVTNTSGISPSNLRVVIDYDGAPINPASIAVERTAITAGVTLGVDTATPGRIAITTSGSTVFAGEGRIFDVFAAISADAPDGACGTLSFTEAVFEDAFGSAVSADRSATAQLCVSGQCKMGDLDGNGIVQMADATVALQITVRKVFPQGCQPTVGDMNGDGFIDSADAVMIMRIAQDRPLNPGVGETPVRGRTLNIYLPSDLRALPGETLSVPIMIDNPEGLSGIELLVTYPPQLTSLVLDSVERGSATQNFSLEYVAGNGFVRIALSRDEALTGSKSPQSLAILHFTVSETAPNNTNLPIGINEVKLAGQYGDDFVWQNDVQASGGMIAVGSLVCGAVVVSVVDNATSLPVTNASVQIVPGPPFPLTQNTQGIYTFACIGPGSHKVSVTAPSYPGTTERNVLVIGGDVSTVEVRMSAGGGGNDGCCGGVVRPVSPSGAIPYAILAVMLSFDVFWPIRRCFSATWRWSSARHRRARA